VSNSTPKPYEHRPVETSAAALLAVENLFRLVWPTARHLTRDYLRWLYVENPSGHVIGFNAWAGDVVAGHYAVIPIDADMMGRRVRGSLSLNTAVHPQHQGKGLFTLLADQTYELARQSGIDHVVGVANANSTPGFVKKLQFQLVRPLDVLVLWRSASRGEEESGAVPAWRRAWDEASLSWRLSNPSVRYWARERRGCRQLLAPTGRPGVHAVLKLDRLHPRLTRIPSTIRRGPLAGIQVWMGLSRYVCPPALGRVRLPARLRPSPLNLIFRDLTPAGRILDPTDVEFEALDFDAY